MTAPSTVDYVVEVLPAQHELDITITLAGAAPGGTLRLQIPTWVPGYYAFQPYARDLFVVTARNADNGDPLTVERDGWQGFRVDNAPDRVTVHYRAYGFVNEMSEDSGIVEETYAILPGTRYLYTLAHTGPCTVRYKLPDGWAIHHPSGADPVGAGMWQYPSYEILLDTPVVVGQFDLETRNVAGTPIYGVFVERGVGFEETVGRFMDDLQKVANSFHDMFGKFPFTDYTFVMTLNPAADWGLEHLSSSSCALGPDVFTVPDQYAIGVRVCAHEMFHAWNVRRLRPTPLDKISTHLECGCFTEGMWIAEGFTRYYEFLMSARAGVYTAPQVFSNIVGYFQSLTVRPAYNRVGEIDSSLSTYLNHSKYSGRVNNSIDYYDKGMLIAFEIDTTLRLQKPGYTLDRAFKEFYNAFVADGVGYAGYTTANAISFFGSILPSLGERLQSVTRDPGALLTPSQLESLGFAIGEETVTYLGLMFLDGISANINDVLDDSPAGVSGIAPQDVLTTVNGYAFSPQALTWAATHSATVTLGVMRGHRPLQFTITPAKRTVVSSLTWKGTDDQAARIRDWIGDTAFAPAPGTVFPVDFYENFHGIETVV
jgi:predicted metalloprotease with PDZ domain